MNDHELQSVIGGGLSTTLINAAIRAFTVIYDFGRSMGTAIRRARAGKVCKVS